MDWGVEVVFGLPGDGINGIMEALRVRQDRIRFIHVRHEESAAFMACAYAKYTGRLGVCLATSGPGGIHLLNGLYDAKLDRAPVARHHGACLPRPDRHPPAAGRGPGPRVHGRRRLQHPGNGAGPRRERHAPGVPHRARLQGRRAHQLSGGPAGAGGRRAIQAQRRRAQPRRRRTQRPRSAPVGLEKGGRAAERDRRSRFSWSGREPWTRPRSSSRSPSGSARRSSRRSWERRPSRTTRPTRPAGSGCSGRSRPRRPSRIATRCFSSGLRSLTSSSIPSPATRARSRSTSTRRGSACGIPSRSGSSETAVTRSRSCCRCSTGARTGTSWRRPRRG